jgi:uncharacterized membrane protein YedE/YeeE
MEFTIHNQILTAVFVLALVMGAVANKTNFCTMGAVSDWVNMGDTGRLRAWLLAIAVAILGVAAAEGRGLATIGNSTFPPYRTPNFAWLRYLLGGLMFGIGMTLASGCGNKTLVRIGGGNLKSLVVLAIASACAYLMLWTDFYGTVFNTWIVATTIDLGKPPAWQSQALSELTGGGTHAAGRHRRSARPCAAGFAFASRDFRGSFDNILGGLVIGLAVVVGWYITAGSMGAPGRSGRNSPTPCRAASRCSPSLSSARWATARYLMNPANVANINFGITALAG